MQFTINRNLFLENLNNAMRAISDNGDANADNDFDKFVKEVGAKAAKLISDYVEKMN